MTEVLQYENMNAESIKKRYLNEPDPDTPEKLLLRKEIKNIIEAKLARLDTIEQSILEMHYGLRGKSEMTIAEIANKGGLGLTIGQITHKEQLARRKIAMLTPRLRREQM